MINSSIFSYNDRWTIYCEDNSETMNRMEEHSVNLVLTSPFYNTNMKSGGVRTLSNTNVKSNQYDYVRYDVFTDNMTNQQYADYTVNLFNNFDKILKPNGCVLYNLSYGAENTESMFVALNSILSQTNFTIADMIVWKKKTAFPNSCSSNRLTRICEYVFVLCRRNESKSFFCNKKVTSIRRTGQRAYENIYNFIEAENNDGSCPYNKATYSTELCEKLLEIYAPKQDCMVYDPFMGSGTTLIACMRMGLNCIGSEISKNQCNYAAQRAEKEIDDLKRCGIIRHDGTSGDSQMNIFDFIQQEK